MDYRKYNWASSISSIITKTKKNLEKGSISTNSINDDGKNSYIAIPSPTVESITRERKSFNFDNEDMLNNRFDFLQFKNMVIEKFKKQEIEIENLNKRYNDYDKNEFETLQFKEDINSAIVSIEKRLVTDIRRLETLQRSSITYKNLKESEENLKNEHIDNINRLELSIQDLKYKYDRLPYIIAKETEENLKNLSKKFISINDIQKVKETLLKNNENYSAFSIESLNEIKQKYEDIDKKYSICTHSLYETISKLQCQIERSVKNLKESLMNIEGKVINKASNNEEMINKVNIYYQDIYEDLSKQVREHINDNALESKINELAKKIIKLPNFNDFIKKNDVIDITKEFVDDCMLNVFVKKSEIIKILEEKLSFYDLQKFVSKNDLEEVQKHYKNILEKFKVSAASKVELEKIKK